MESPDLGVFFARKFDMQIPFSAEMFCLCVLVVSFNIVSVLRCSVIARTAVLLSAAFSFLFGKSCICLFAFPD
jgi:hypothetical protein